MLFDWSVTGEYMSNFRNTMYQVYLFCAHSNDLDRSVGSAISLSFDGIGFRVEY